MRTLGGVVAVSLLWVGCAGPKLEIVPSLMPVDASRPYVVYRPVKGTACGKDAAAGAMEDLFRVSGVHGFVAAVIEQERTGDRCVTITARPITYGCTPQPPVRIDDPAPLRVVPGPTSCPETPDVCTPECTRYGNALGGGEFETRAFRERCISRCRNNDSAFMTCARAATSPSAVKACDAN